MKDLKPCAFCGGAGHVYEDGRLSIKPYDFPKWYIMCKKCGIRTPTAKMEQIVRIWNRRAEPVTSPLLTEKWKCQHMRGGQDE